MYVENVMPNADPKQSSLVTFKQHSLQDAEVFAEPRKLVVAMFQKIDEELVIARS